ncbi:uncharacterized protein [Oscarella lobularis]|uniref:uncharacterized protein isoform X2 n=1 Tax=Oscarella lobularis TaxID=121494 RepID=UPI003313C9CF
MVHNRRRTDTGRRRRGSFRTLRPGSAVQEWIDDDIEKECEADGKPVSPTLAQLKNQQHHVATRRRELMAKHLESKSKPLVGGGVTMWPAMDDMRLSRNDVIFLGALCLALILCMCATVIAIHGDAMTKLTRYTEEMRGFSGKYRLTDNASFRESVLTWHGNLSTLMDKIDRDLVYSWSDANFFDWMLCLLYTCGITALLWHLYDNILAKNRLTPRRIKAWISLLVAVLVLTSLGLYFLVKAHLLEDAIRKTVRNFIKEMVLFRMEWICLLSI